MHTESSWQYGEDAKCRLLLRFKLSENMQLYNVFHGEESLYPMSYVQH